MSHGNTKGEGFVPPSPEELDAILDAYEFLGMLGRGGMGAVYKARQKSLDRLVAIKILPPGLTDGDEADDGFFFAERFQREARAMAKLSHPNIIGVYDFGRAPEGQFYFVMEYIEGTDLHELIQGGGLTVDHVAGWMSQICDALQYAHARGIVHRDIKPANIMITLEGQVKVADFGLAKLTGTEEVQTKLTMTNMAMGTPDYVAPEALEAGMEVDHRADLYAVGVMLYEMLTGKVPRGAWKPASTQVAGLDPRYDELIERAMDSDRNGRFQQASEIGATIYEIATEPPRAAPINTSETSRDGAGSIRDRPPRTGGGDVPGNRGGDRAGRQGGAKSKIPVVPIVAVICLLVLAIGAMMFRKKEPVVALAEISPPSFLGSNGASLPAAPPLDGSAAAGAPFAPVSPAPSAPAHSSEEGWIDLLSRVEVGRDSLVGRWTLESGSLRSPANPREASRTAHTSLVLDAPSVSDHYDLRWVLTRNALGFVIGFVFPMEGRNVYLVGDDLQDGKRSLFIKARERLIVQREDAWFDLGDRHELLFSVRGDHLRVHFDGEMVLDSRVEDSFEADRFFFPPAKINRSTLGIGVCAGRITVHEASYRVVVAP